MRFKKGDKVKVIGVNPTNPHLNKNGVVTRQYLGTEIACHVKFEDGREEAFYDNNLERYNDKMNKIKELMMK